MTNSVNPHSAEGRVVAVGQIWRERDPRHERFVFVDRVGDDWALIRACDEPGHNYMPRSRHTYAKLARFNGKRGGYSFHAMRKQP